MEANSSFFLFCQDEVFEYETYLLVKEFFPEKEIMRQKRSADAFLVCNYGAEESSFVYALNGETGEIAKPVSAPAGSKAFKNEHMHHLYEALCAMTHKSLPWGSLTGVRPTKFAREMILSGKTQEEIESFYRDDRFVSEEKAGLAYSIAERESQIIASTDAFEGYSLYIGIPFCPSRCLYCSFLSGPIAKWQSRIDEYLSCIEKELVFVSETFKDKPLNTIYIGGGTPTALSASELERLMEMIHRFVNVKDTLEFTVEAGRPDSITEEKCKVLKSAGVNRISVNPQTMNDETLRIIGRNHTVEQTLEAYRMVSGVGFDNINMDIILGLPKEGEHEITRTMEEIAACAPQSLTVHSLALKRSAEMKDWIKGLKDAESVFAEDPAKMMEIACEYAQKMGLNPYYLYRQKNIAGNLENVGFAKEGKYGIYNILMMEEVQSIVALGAGTVSKRVDSPTKIERCDTAKDIGLYMDRIDEMIERKRELFSNVRMGDVL